MTPTHPSHVLSWCLKVLLGDISRVSAIFLIIGVVTFCNTNGEGPAQLELYQIGKMNVDKTQLTLSGFSAGASMAIQTHLSHSSLFTGLAIFSQAFYHCGHRSLIEFGIRCSKTGLGIFPYNVNTSVSDAKKYDRRGLIDPLTNLATQKIFIWTGKLDAYIPPDMAASNVDFYKAVGVNPDNIRFTMFDNASHLIPTKDFGPPCNEDAAQFTYLGNCDYPGPYHALSYILRNDLLVEGEEFDVHIFLNTDTPDPSRLKQYNQSAFYPAGNISDVAMGATGFIYIPVACETQKCLLHLNFHGCNEWPPEVAEEYILNSGFLSISEGNGIIMIFPLTTKTPNNMDGCWDFFSYTGRQFATKQGAQIQVIERMLQKILSEE